MDEQINTFKGDFYTQRMRLENSDALDNRVPSVNPMNLWALKSLDAKVTLGATAGMAERDWHSVAMRHHEKALSVNGPKAVAGREDSLHPVIVNQTTKRQEPLVLAQMNDRLALMQEITVGLCTRSDNEIELIRLLQRRGITNENRYTDDDDEEYHVGQ
jgi:hypothetical protein